MILNLAKFRTNKMVDFPKMLVDIYFLIKRNW